MADPTATADVLSHLLTGGGGAGGGAIATFVALRLFSKNGISNADLAGKMDTFIEHQQVANMLLAEIKGGLSK